MTILDKIVRHKKKEIAALKKKRPFDSLKKAVAGQVFRKRSFERALRAAKTVAVIAEIKKKSPSRGLLRKDFNPVEIAKAYKKGGASALSVLTDSVFFGGSPEILKKVRSTTTLPILRKDFMIDEYQIWEARAMGADAILLIAAILTNARMKRFYEVAKRLDLDVLFEVHSKAELNRVMRLKPRLVGVNNRDLKTFEVSLDTTKKLARFVKTKALLVSESGIFTSADVKELKKAGARAVLVGEGLIRHRNIAAALKNLLRKK